MPSHHSNDRIETSKSRFKACPQDGQNDTTPVHLSKGVSNKYKKISPDADDSLAALEAEVVKHIRSNSKSRHDNDRMDSQLEVIVQGTSISPMPMQKHTMTKISKLPSDGTPKKKKQKTDGYAMTIQDPKHTSTPSSPKRRTRFKSPESSFDNDLPSCDVATEGGSINIVVGFTGMMVFPRKDEMQLPESCF